MNKTLKTILAILGVLAVLLLAVFAKPNKGYKTIKYEEYKNLSEPSIVYIGDNKDTLSNFKDLNIDKNYSVKHLGLKGLEEKDKNETVEIWKDGKLVDEYSFDTLKIKYDKKTSLKKIDINKYYELMKADGLNFLVIGREGCGYCQMFKEVIEQFHKEYKLDIYYLDTDELDEEGYNKLYASDEYFEGSWGTPTSVIYYNGEKVNIISGYSPLESLINRINSIELIIFLKENKVI